MRVIFFGTPDFALPSLLALVQAFEVAAVVTRPDRPRGRGKRMSASPVKEEALKKGLFVSQVSTKKPEFLEWYRDMRPDAAVVVAFGEILPESVLNVPRLGSINLHASLLPAYRGAAPIHRAVMNGDTLTGVTTMYMDKGMDTGDIILHEEVAIGPDDNTGKLHDRLAAQGAEILAATLVLLGEGNAPRRKQDERYATYAMPLTAEDEIIDWAAPAKSVVDRIRGLDPWPGARTTWRDRILKVWGAGAGPAVKEGRPGQIIRTGAQGFLVQAGEGTVFVREVQLQGGKRLAAGDFLRGARLEAGEILS